MTPSKNWPPEFAVAVTPDDDVPLPPGVTALWIGTGGTTLTVTMKGGGNDVVFANVPDGTLLEIAVTAVKETGTDATDIVALS